MENPATWNDDVKAINEVFRQDTEDANNRIVGHSLMAKIEQAVVAPLRNKLDYILKVLALFDKHDLCWNLMWRPEGNNPGFAVDCSDMFWWGCADAECLTPERLPNLIKAIEDGGEDDGLVLYCARIRKMRPQGCMYKNIKEEHWHLFDECGPLREVGLGNPHKHPSEINAAK